MTYFLGGYGGGYGGGHGHGYGGHSSGYGGHGSGYGGGHGHGYGGGYGGYRAAEATDDMPQIPEQSIPQQVSKTKYHFSHIHEP